VKPFFFVYSYSQATYIDHCGVHFTQFSCGAKSHNARTKLRTLILLYPHPASCAVRHVRIMGGRRWRTGEGVRR